MEQKRKREEGWKNIRSHSDGQVTKLMNFHTLPFPRCCTFHSCDWCYELCCQTEHPVQSSGCWSELFNKPPWKVERETYTLLAGNQEPVRYLIICPELRPCWMWSEIWGPDLWPPFENNTVGSSFSLLPVSSLLTMFVEQWLHPITCLLNAIPANLQGANSLI